MPDLDKLRLDPFAFSLLEVKPLYVCWNTRFTCFGMSLNDSEFVCGGYGKYERVARLPDNIRRIEVNHMSKGYALHSMKFVGDTELYVGNIDKFKTPVDQRKFKTEILEIPEGKEFFGCEILKVRYLIVVFLVWTPFDKEKANDLEAIMRFCSSENLPKLRLIK